MTLQNKHKHYQRIFKPKSARLANALALTLKRGIYSGLFSVCCISVSQAQNTDGITDVIEASDIDWVTRADLDASTQANLPENCCGRYVEPELSPPPGEPETIDLSADGNITISNSPGDNIITLEDNVEIRQMDKFMRADYGVYNRDTEVIDLSGDIRLRQPGMLLIGTDAELDQTNGTSELNNASYVLHPESIRGSADIIVFRDADGIITIDNGLYTRCEPGDNSWIMSGGKITLDQEVGRGVARNATLRIKGVPVFYTPYMSFPINDQRASGFLAPTFGSSNNGGFDLSTPYYLNLAPNYDATITPRLLTDRGVMINMEGRYRGLRSTNILSLGYLPGDKSYDESTVGIPGTDSPDVEDRWLVDYDYRARFGNNWNASIDYSEVSDKDYFRDLSGIGLDTLTISYLNRNAQITYRGTNWNFTTSSQSFQVIDPTVSQLNLPYDSLPRLNLTGYFDNDLGIRYGVDSEYVSFTRHLDRNLLSQGQIDRGALVSGQRLAIEPMISWPWSTPGMFVTPTMKYKYATYQLDDQNLTVADQQSRGIFMASLDSGLIFERDFEFGSNDYIQTLEPRIFYLYSEYDDQSDIPIFDSAEMTFSFSQLFREDRFSGKDRVGDSNQVTLALSSNIYDSAGQQKASASIGQIFYLEDRRVSLNNIPNPTLRHSGSATAAELSYQFNDNWRASTYLEWNTNTQAMDAGNVQFRYQSDFDHILNLSYRYRDELPRLGANLIDRRTIQTDVSGIWPLVGNWGLIGRWNYDHANERNLETIIGVQYDTCCWNVRVVAREWIDIDDLLLADVENDTGIFLQFELKGLGSVLGGNVSSILSNGISGYREYEYD